MELKQGEERGERSFSAVRHEGTWTCPRPPSPISSLSEPEGQSSQQSSSKRGAAAGGSINRVQAPQALLIPVQAALISCAPQASHTESSFREDSHRRKPASEAELDLQVVFLSLKTGTLLFLCRRGKVQLSIICIPPGWNFQSFITLSPINASFRYLISDLFKL